MPRNLAGLKRGGSPGRPKGCLGKKTLFGQQFAQKVLHDPEVQARMLKDAKAGKLAPPVISTLMHYAWGKPKDSLSIDARVAPLIIDAFRPEDATRDDTE